MSRGAISEGVWWVIGKSMDLPPLFFKGPYAYGQAPSIDYAVEKPLLGLPAGSKRQNWRIGVFDCFNAQDTGLNCFCAHCCCSIWIWKNAVALVPYVQGEENVLRQTVRQDAMRSARDAAQSANNNQGNIFADVYLAGQQVDVTFSRADVRSQLFSVLYDDWELVDDPLQAGKKIRKVKKGGYSPYHSNDGLRYFYVTCCGSCAAVQAVDAIQTWSLEKYGQPLKYGPLNPLTCTCCSLYAPNGALVKELPYPSEWAAAPVVPTMVR